MGIRRLGLDEWFLAYQLRKMSKRHFHLPGSLDLDITQLSHLYESRGIKIPYTALLIKAVALAARQHPQLNRMYFKTFWGERMVDFDEVIVNVPVVMSEGGKTYLSATSIERANTLKICVIAEKLRAARSKKLAETKVTKFVAGKNTFLKRSILRVIYFLVFNFPHLYVKRGGGGVSVSSLQNLESENLDMRFFPYGPTAVTFGLITVKKTAERIYLKVGVGYDHLACRADEITVGLKALADILALPHADLVDLP